MSHATEVAAASDDMIRVYPPREGSGYIDYAIGKGSVLWRGGDSYLCGTCQGNDRWANAEHKGCAHIARIVKYREEHP
ncbi:MAG: hypothetical protein M3P26_16300 [Gemmatimonadota bacterium]|nr:hypothetical protein [Gemmatimonadota bacterium]